MHISGLCEAKKADIESEKPHIERKISENAVRLSSVRMVQIRKLLEKFGYEKFFGRSDIKELLGTENSAASKLSSILVSNGIVEPVSGHGKGKYKFKKIKQSPRTVQKCMVRGLFMFLTSPQRKRKSKEHH